MAILKAGDLSREELIELLRQLQLGDDPAGNARIWVEAPDGWALDYWPAPDGSLPWCAAQRQPARRPLLQCLHAAWSGRVFAASGELRWRVLDGLAPRECRAVFLGDRDCLPGCLLDRSDALQGLTAQHERYFLWGQQTELIPGEWIELRIPHRFRYPVSGRPRGVRAVVEVWRDALGEHHFERWCGLEPYLEAE
jgi:hypothetical protein